MITCAWCGGRGRDDVELFKGFFCGEHCAIEMAVDRAQFEKLELNRETGEWTSEQERKNRAEEEVWAKQK